jgi:predicted nucleotidyltransferase
LGSLEMLDKTASVLAKEPEEFKTLLKKHLNTGVTFPKARESALVEFTKNEEIAQALKSSNNILAIEYLKALKKINSTIKPYTISRIMNEYNSKSLSGEISSATSLRDALLNSNNIESIKAFIPQSTFEVLSDDFFNGKGPVFTSYFNELVISTIRKASLDEIRKIFDVNEGLENRIKKAASKVSCINELVEIVKTKRYTRTRIQRILFQLLLGIDRQIYAELSQNGPQYIRVLGFSKNGREILNAAKKKSSLPIITKFANHNNTANALFNQMLQYDITATDLYTLAYKNPSFKVGVLDYTHEIIME